MRDPLHWLMGTRLEVPTKLVPADVLFVVVALLVLLPSLRLLRRGGRTHDLWRLTAVRAAVALVGALVGLAVCWIVGDVTNTFDTVLTAVTRMWVAFAFAALALAGVGLVHGGRARRWTSVALVPLALVVPALGINVDYAAYPTLNTLVRTDPYPALHLGDQGPVAGHHVPSAATWTPPADMPTTGVIGSVRIPGRASGFPARPAVVYLPPAARTADPPALPVIVSLSGQPGGPSDMFSVGRLGDTLDRYAAAHHGLAPIVVSADQLAVPGHNTMCVDSRLGNAATYITQDVPDWITTHLRVAPDRRAWGLVGFSEGATCSVQFLTGHPDGFSAALAIASELQPVDRGPENSADEAFGGSLAAWRAAAPIALMHAHGPYTHHALWMTAGANDSDFADHAMRITRAATEAGIRATSALAPGSGHDWNTVQWSLHRDLPREADFLFGAIP
ncbi:esterase family protein [Curtobacterium sp. ISL-83]|uniref:alpha/beta hydrolase n=1 Tax=Curtobacterium sp. ISL-83 TaxID=2819145 RepID=UPI001BE5B926|nr:alpha/beta hydrolase-fold protein [Curtobacterium sp. ISL-83]MBT2502555.1 hypothetical protein [Curtobacterium sp. ISL-83]